MVEAATVALLAVVALSVTASAAPIPRGRHKPLSQHEVEEIARKVTDKLVEEVSKAAHEGIKDTNTTDMNDQEDDETDEDEDSTITTSDKNQGNENPFNKETLSQRPKDDAKTLKIQDSFNTKRPDKTVMEKEHFFEDINFPRDNASRTNQKGTGEHKKLGDTNEDLEKSDSGAQQKTIINQKVNKGGKKSGDHDEDLDESNSKLGKKKEGKLLSNAQPSALKNPKEISTTPVEPNKNKILPLEFEEIYSEIKEITKGNEEAKTTKSRPKQTHVFTATANPVTNTKPPILIDNNKYDLKTEAMLPSSPANKWKSVTDSESEYGIHSMPKCKSCMYGQTGMFEKASTADPTAPVDYTETNWDEEEVYSSTFKAFLQDMDEEAQEIGRRLAKVLSIAARARRNAPEEEGWGNEVISFKPFHSAQEKAKKKQEKLSKQDRPFLIDADGDHIMLIPNDPLSSPPPSPAAQNKKWAEQEQHQPQQTHTPTTPSQQALIAQLQRLKDELEEERAVTLKQAAEKDRQEELEMSKSARAKDGAKPNTLDEDNVVLIGEGVKHSPHSTPQVGEYMAHSKLDEGDSKIRHRTYTYQNEDRSEKNSAAPNMFSEILHKSISGESESSAGRKQCNRCRCCQKQTTRVDGMSSNLREQNGSSSQRKSNEENRSGNFSGFIPKLILGNSKGEGNASFIQHMLVQTVVGPGSDGQLKADSAIVIHNSFDSASSPSDESSFTEEASQGKKSKAASVAKGRMKEMLPVSSAQNAPKSIGSDSDGIDLGVPGTLRGSPEVTNNGNSGIIHRKNIPSNKKESEDEDEYIVATGRPTALSRLVKGKFGKRWTTSMNDEEHFGASNHVMPQVGHTPTGSDAQRNGAAHPYKLTTAGKDKLQDDSEPIDLDAPGTLRGRPEIINNGYSGIIPRKNIPFKKKEAESEDGYILAAGRPTALSLLAKGKFGKRLTTSINDEEDFGVPTHVMPQVGHSLVGSDAQRNGAAHPYKLTTAGKDKLQDDDLPQVMAPHSGAGGRSEASGNRAWEGGRGALIWFPPGDPLGHRALVAQTGDQGPLDPGHEDCKPGACPVLRDPTVWEESPRKPDEIRLPPPLLNPL